MRIENSTTSEGSCSASEPIDPRVRRTRKLLEDALRSLISEKRFSAISVQDIAARATVNRATFYAHYVDKQDLATSALKADLRNAVLKLFDDHPTLTHQNLAAVANVVFIFLSSMYDACPETATEIQGNVATTLQEELYVIMEYWLSNCKAFPQMFPDCSKSTVAAVFSWSIYGAAHQWSRSKSRPPAAKVCEEIVSILLPP